MEDEGSVSWDRVGIVIDGVCCHSNVLGGDAVMFTSAEPWSFDRVGWRFFSSRAGGIPLVSMVTSTWDVGGCVRALSRGGGGL